MQYRKEIFNFQYIISSLSVKLFLIFLRFELVYNFIKNRASCISSFHHILSRKFDLSHLSSKIPVKSERSYLEGRELISRVALARLSVHKRESIHLSGKRGVCSLVDGGGREGGACK